MKKFFSIGFWDYAAERALKTGIQVAIAGGLIGGGLATTDWSQIGSISGGAVLLSLATSFLAFKGDGTDDPNALESHSDVSGK